MSEVASNNSEKLENSVHGQNDKVEEPVTATTNNTNTKEASSGAPTAADCVGDTASKAEIAVALEISPNAQNKKTPVKRTPSKRMSFIERAQKESEELVKNLGGSLELEGGRRTRSSTRGTPTRSAVAATPPPAKKARASPAANVTAATPVSRRGRGRKIDISSEPTDTELTTDDSKKTEATDQQMDTVKPIVNNDTEKSSVENAENSVVDAANSAAAADEKQSLEVPKNTDNIVSLDSKLDDKANVALESIPEEKQNNVDHLVEKMEDEKTDSAMETDDDAKRSSESDAAAAPSTAAVKEIKDTSNDNTSTSASDAVTGVIEKEPMLEPMVVDSSSSNDSDNIESTLITAENVKKDIPEPDLKTTGSTETDGEVIQNPSDAQTDKPVVSEVVEDGEALLPATTDETTSQCVNVKTSTIAAVEPQATANSTSDTTVDSINKSENDLCEPKIVSPSKTSDGSVVVTSQYCN